jgi:ribonuclease I
MRNAAFITTIANYIVDRAEAGWNLENIIGSIRADRSEVTLDEFQAALAEAFHDDTSKAVKMLAIDAMMEELQPVIREVCEGMTSRVAENP